VELAEPSRIYITASDGLGYAPAGAISRFAPLAAEQFFHARESFEIDLPAGETVVEAARGLEYEWASRRLDLRRPTTIRLAPRRWIDMASRGWYSSDAHIHANYTADHHQTITPGDVLTYTLAEDLHIPNLMVANSFGAFIHDREHFTGAPHALSRPPYILWWNEEMRNGNAYGHMCFYGLRQLVEPLYTGFANTPYADEYPPNYAQAKAARAQGGAVTYAHPGYSAAIEGFSARELPVDLALGEVDALDVMSNNPEEFAMQNWYRLLNCGFRLAISAGTDSFTNVADHYVPGGHRVYVHTGAGRPLSYDSWLAGYKAGRSFATNGPMIFLSVNGREPGDEISLPAGRHRLRVKVEVRAPSGGQDRLELIVNGIARPVVSEIEIDRGSWIAARVMGPWRRSVLNDDATFAHSSPVYVRVGGELARSPDDARFWAEWIDKLIARTIARGGLKDEAKRAEVIGLFRKAQAIFAQQAR
jgi:TolB protein